MESSRRLAKIRSTGPAATLASPPSLTEWDNKVFNPLLVITRVTASETEMPAWNPTLAAPRLHWSGASWLSRNHTVQGLRQRRRPERNQRHLAVFGLDPQSLVGALLRQFQCDAGRMQDDMRNVIFRPLTGGNGDARGIAAFPIFADARQRLRSE